MSASGQHLPLAIANFENMPSIASYDPEKLLTINSRTAGMRTCRH